MRSWGLAQLCKDEEINTEEKVTFKMHTCVEYTVQSMIHLVIFPLFNLDVLC